MKIILRNDICDKLESIVKNLKISKHCIGCEGLDLSNCNPHHHPSIEITQKCNHNCIFCYSKLVNVKSGIYGINPSNPELEKHVGITISQYGEPLMFPKKVKKAIIWAKNNNLRCDLQTNGVYLNDSLLREYKECGLDIIMVSLSASTPKTHEIITKSDTFKKILENIKLASKYIYTIVRCVYIPGFNEDELIKLAEMLNNESNVKEIMVHQLVIHKENLNDLKNIANMSEIGRLKNLLLLVDNMKKNAPNIDITIKGCLLMNLMSMDGFMLNSISSDCFSEVPDIKREYHTFEF